MNLYYETSDEKVKLYHGDCRRMPEIEIGSIDMIATSPPYWGKRDYGEEVVTIWGGEDECEHEWGGLLQREMSGGPTGLEERPATRWVAASQYCSLCGAWRGQLGLEPTWQEYIAHLCECAREWWRVLKPTGNLFVNIGDTFAGSWGNMSHPRARDYPEGRPPQSAPGMMPKNKLGIPYRLRFALNDMGWVSRADIIWHKGKEYPDGKITKVAMPESVKDRMACSYEMLFHFVKEPRGYWFDLDAVRRPLADSSIGRAERYEEAMEKYGSPERPDSKHRQGGVEQAHAYAGMASGRSKAPYKASGSNPGDVWIIQPEPFPLKHYAVWPSELCERMIKVGCPKEVCPKCGKPRERITRTENPPHDGETESSYAEGTTAKRLAMLRQASRRRGGEFVDQRHTIGWSDCGCGAGFVPGVVLDPFFGDSYRIAKEALKLGRNCIGVDLKEDYLEMAKGVALYGEKGWGKEKERREEGVKQAVLL